MMGPQLYSRRDVRRLMAALAGFVVVPCVLLVFLAWQSVCVLHEAARAQRRETCRRDLRDVGRVLGRDLDDRLARSGETLRGLAPDASAFWIDC